MTMDQNQDRIEKTVDLPASVARVWRAITDHEEFGTWFQVHLDSPFEVGKTTLGNITFPGYEHVKWESKTEKLEDQKLFAFSWPPSAIDPEMECDPNAKMLVEFRLETSQKGTLLTITESGFQQFPEHKRLELQQANAEGWNFQATNITKYLEE